LSRHRSAQRLSLPLLTKQLELVELFVRQRIAVACLVVVRRQLVQQLFDAILFAKRIHVGYLLLGYGRKVLMNLFIF
jgi:hypothetical protein